MASRLVAKGMLPATESSIKALLKIHATLFVPDNLLLNIRTLRIGEHLAIEVRGYSPASAFTNAIRVMDADGAIHDMGPIYEETTGDDLLKMGLILCSEVTSG